MDAAGLVHRVGRPPIMVAGPPLFWRADPAGLWTWSCPQWTRTTGLSEAASLGDGWLDAVHPQDRHAATAPLVAVDGQCHDRPVLRLRSPVHHGYRPVQPNAAPAYGADGHVREWVGAMLADANEVLDPHRRTFELQHHLRNALAVIRSVARRTARTSDTVEHYATHFEGRLEALARVQDAVIRSPGGGVDFESLVGEELLAQRVGEAAVRIEGPAVRLRARAAEPFGLALHELAVNALKFGAFTSSQGLLSIGWAIDRGLAPSVLRFTWRETGIAVLGTAPRRRGFGIETIERNLPYELAAETRLDFGPGQLRCTISLPLTDEMAIVDAP